MKLLLIFLSLNFTHVTTDKAIVTIYTTTSNLDNSVYLDVECGSDILDYYPVYRVWGFPSNEFGFIYRTKDRQVYDCYRVSFVDSLGNKTSTEYFNVESYNNMIYFNVIVNDKFSNLKFNKYESRE